MLYKTGDLLKATDVDVIVHCANVFHCFGSGIARSILEKYPKAFEADKATPRDESKLGYFSKADVGGKWIYNLYAMVGLGNDGNPLHRNLSYDHFYNGMHRVCEDAEKTVKKDRVEIGLPKNIGCCRAGGAWEIVDSILWEIEAQFPHIEFIVYEFGDENPKEFSVIPD